MPDLGTALDDIALIKDRMAGAALFRGFGPAVMAGTGVLAFAAGTVQAVTPTLTASPFAFIAFWTVIASAAALAIAIEAYARTRRHHGGLADAMLFQAAEHFLPVGVVGAVLAVIVVTAAPDIAWVLPGVWSLLVATGLFATHRFLPRTIAIAGAWYLLAGVAALLSAADGRTLSPWSMALVFGGGQLVLAAVLKFAFAPASDAAEDDHV
ncbi:MAG: hypothetical protein AAFR23_03060 [Pseudomonadota bacterium]